MLILSGLQNGQTKLHMKNKRGIIKSCLKQDDLLVRVSQLKKNQQSEPREENKSIKVDFFNPTMFNLGVF